MSISSSEYHKSLYNYRKANALCVRCGKHNQNGKTICDSCTAKRKLKEDIRLQKPEVKEKRRKAVREHYYRNLDEQRRRCRRYRKSKAAKANRNKTDLIRRENRRIDGLCPRCGRPTKIFINCSLCRHKRNLRDKKRNDRKSINQGKGITETTIRPT